MASTDRPIQENPPPYEDGAIPLDNLKAPSITEAESPPAYSTSPDLPERPPKRKCQCHQKWIAVGALLMIVILVGASGGVYGRRAVERNKRIIHDPENPLVVALAAAECDSGTFVLYQTNTSDIYLQGSLRNSYWDYSSEAFFRPMKLDLTGDAAPLYGTSLTAVCWSDPDSSIIRIYFYYMSSPQPVINPYVLIETAIAIPTNFSTPLSITQSRITALTATSSLAAVYLPSYGIKLYFLVESADRATTTIAEISRGWPWWSSSESAPQLGTNNTVLLDTTVHDTEISLAAAAVELPLNSTTRLVEIHVYFVDMYQNVSRMKWSRDDGWREARPILGTNHHTITKLAAITPRIYNGSTQSNIWFIASDHRVYDTWDSTLTEEYPNPVIDETLYAHYDLPSAYQYPDALIAVTCWNVGTNQSFKIFESASGYYGTNEEAGERIQVFYLGDKNFYRDKDEYDNGRWIPVANAVQMGRGIWNITGKVDNGFESFPTYEYPAQSIYYEQQPDWGL